MKLLFYPKKKKKKMRHVTRKVALQSIYQKKKMFKWAVFLVMLKKNLICFIIFLREYESEVCNMFRGIARDRYIQFLFGFPKNELIHSLFLIYKYKSKSCFLKFEKILKIDRITLYCREISKRRSNIWAPFFCIRYVLPIFLIILKIFKCFVNGT